MTIAVPQPIWVDNHRMLAEVCEKLAGLECIGVDTEFIRTNTFYAKLGLVQLSDGIDCWLVDPIAISNLSPLRKLLAAPTPLKLFHSCSEDIDVLRSAVEIELGSLFDTQVAAAFANIDYSLGYSRLVEHFLGIELGKHATRSDWLQRPLTQEQCQYAAEDVIYLPEIYRQLKAKLDELGRADWLAEDMAELLTPLDEEQQIAQYYQRIGGAWQLNDQQLALLQRLAEWREGQARERDKPRSHIVDDKTLLQLALSQPRSRNQLAQVEGLHPGTQRRYGQRLLALVAEKGDAKELESIPRPLTRAQGDRLKVLRSRLNEVADQHQIPVQLLANKKDLEQLLRNELLVARGAEPIELPSRLTQSWRAPLILQPLTEALSAS